jgi:hypothetical protein
MKEVRPHIPSCRALIWAWLIAALISASCSGAVSTSPAPTTALASPSATSSPAPSNTLSPSAASSPTPSPTLTRTPTDTPTPSVTPTYAILRGEVLVRANCRYGPGAPYLYKYGLVPGSNLEVIGRNDLGTWILVRAIGGNNPCWVKASLLDVKGEVMRVAPTYIPLPPSPYYHPPTGVSAIREGDQVSIFWNPIALKEGDDSGQYPYVIEAWVCQDGRLTFTPLGTYQTVIKITDEQDCSEPSHGQLLGAEKHGYTRPVEIPWP